jgi:P-type E1-E2 ATPase
MLTYGELRVVDVVLQSGFTLRDAVDLAARLGEGSAHPVSRALVRYAVEVDPRHVDEVPPAPFDAMQELRGLGVTAQTPNGVAVLGRHALLAEHVGGLPPPAARAEGPCVGLALNGQLVAWFAFADVLRSEAHDALADLRELGLRRYALLTGDRAPVAHALAERLGLETVMAEALPHEKLEFVIDEMKAGRHPLVVGDGLNDLLAIKAGTTSIAMGERGIDVAVASADIVLLGDDLRRIATCVRLGRQCRRTATINAAIGLGWTVGVIALAALGLMGAVTVALLHNLGTFIVIANAGRLLRIDERPAP